MKKVIKKILKLFIHPELRSKIRALLNLPDQINVLWNRDEKLNQLKYLTQQIDELKQQCGNLSYELFKVKTLLLLKEQAPELLQKFSLGLCNDNDLISSLTQTNIFNVLHDDLRNNMGIILQKFLCGAPGLSLEKIYNNQLNISKNPLYTHQAFLNILNVFLPHYENNDIASAIDQMYDMSFLNRDPWGTVYYMSWLLLRKEEEKALDILHKYLKHYGTEIIEGLIPIADLAYRNGIINEDIVAASQLFQTIMKNVNDHILENYIDKFGDNATIAIVGNGPHELGFGKGDEIDAHDIVIRFNCFDNSEKYIKDYGKKTNLIMFAASMEFDPQMFSRSTYLFITHSLYTEPFSKNMRNYYKQKPFSNITTIGLSATRREIQERYGINWSTTGFLCVYFLKNILKKKIKQSDIYGFALNHDLILDGHYENTMKMKTENLKMHDLHLELQAMKDMFKEDCKVAW